MTALGYGEHGLARAAACEPKGSVAPTPQLQEGSSAGRTLLRTTPLLRRQSGLCCRSAPSSWGLLGRRGLELTATQDQLPQHTNPSPAALLSALPPRSSASSLPFCWFGRAGQLSPFPGPHPCPSAVQGWLLLLLLLFREAVPDAPLNPHLPSSIAFGTTRSCCTDGMA